MLFRSLGGGDWCRDRIATDIVRAIFEKNEEIIIRSPQAIRPWLYVLEPLYGYILLAKRLYSGKKEFVGSWNFGPKESNYLTVEQLTKTAIKILGQGSYKTKPDFKKHQAILLKLNNNKAKKLLDWQPQLDIETILEFTFNWYRAFYEKKNIVDLTNQQINSFSKLWH